MYIEVKKILEKIAKDNNLSFEQIKQMMDSQFLCTKEIMKRGIHDHPDTFENINIIKLGKIYAKKKVIEKMKNSKERSKKRNNDKKMD